MNREEVGPGSGLRPLPADEWGDGSPPVVLLHGFTGSAAAWGEELLREFGRDRRVLVLDLPGHGREGERAPENFSRTLDRIEATLDARGVERADWVGYSMGGRLALAGAIERPQRVRRLVLEGASPGLAGERERAARRRQDDELAERILSEGLEWFVDSWMSQPIFHSQRALPRERLEGARRLRLGQAPTGLAASLRTLGTGAQPSYWDRLGEVEAEVLLLTGSLDPKFGAIAREMSSRLPKAWRRVVEGAGHAVHLEAPSGWLKELSSFLSAPEGQFQAK